MAALTLPLPEGEEKEATRRVVSQKASTSSTPSTSPRPLGPPWRQGGARATIARMPDVKEYLRPEVIQQVARLELKARFIVEGFLAGLHDSPYHGFSTEFSEHRKYTIGDDLKDIDWNVYARTDRFYVKKFQAETNLNTYLLVDTSESMAFSWRPGAMSKLDYAICIAAALGYLMLSQQDAVGLATFDETVVSFVPPRSRRAHLAGIIRALSVALRHRPSLLAPSLHRAAEMLRRRGLAIVLSDLIPGASETLADVLAALEHLRYRGHDVICFHVLDHAELTLPYEGPTRFVDTESGQEVRVHPAAVREDYRREIRSFIEFFRTGCAKARIDYVQVDTSLSFDSVLIPYLAARKSHF